MSQPPSVAEVEAQEDSCVLPSFDADVAWELGTTIRSIIQKEHGKPAVIYIALAGSQQMLFWCATAPGTKPDNMNWVRRKEAVVLRWGVSTWRMRAQLAERGVTLKERFEMNDASMYAAHGGGFPIRVKGIEGTVGVIVVSGMTQEDDHSVIVQGIQQYLSKLGQ
ncbi:hypothetical protein CONPUDRAFT_149533 [Coniophora puteana RWD-64-598 SS2]|uniref:DUF336-domain-containing protein n=1 Tax=Coniophora puteana (strain RWD-64-598) TaxID=741705 RepID=A0A5M3N0W1_CONPW|nr:uncharacterized protein CONPUDRAFT_149533 [Coniophora puteana RWD-64-598 SS2]EIW84654.1 hypothetical protein CONPUDRAFT_149533 [Coniophora puteana RWD-64-598 SS2]